MSRIASSEVEWRRLRGAQFRHAVRPSGDYYEPACTFSWPVPFAQWEEAPSASKCTNCARRVEPAPAEEENTDA